MEPLQITLLPRKGQAWQWAANMIANHHYLGCMPDPRTSYDVFGVVLHGYLMGALVCGRPEATRCGDWYGGLDDVGAGRCQVTRWQVLNLSRAFLSQDYQRGGAMCRPDVVPGYADRHRQFRSTLASTVLRAAVATVGYEYLRVRPPCFLDEPYQIEWLLSYCDTRLHRGTIYAAAGFELYRTNADGIQTWRIRVPPLTPAQDIEIRNIANVHPRSIKYRAKRAQMAIFEMGKL